MCSTQMWQDCALVQTMLAARCLTEMIVSVHGIDLCEETLHARSTDT